MDEKFVLTEINFAKGKAEKDLEEQFKQSLKKFQGRKALTDSDSQFSVRKVIIAQGLKKEKKQFRKRLISGPTGDN